MNSKALIAAEVTPEHRDECRAAAKKLKTNVSKEIKRAMSRLIARAEKLDGTQ
tara:strand:- start:1662 stop:1820 length:159 start_codon:yes stop_codon:yes gene_type:complete